MLAVQRKSRDRFSGSQILGNDHSTHRLPARIMLTKSTDLTENKGLTAGPRVI